MREKQFSFRIENYGSGKDEVLSEERRKERDQKLRLNHEHENVYLQDFEITWISQGDF